MKTTISESVNCAINFGCAFINKCNKIFYEISTKFTNYQIK